MAQPLRGRALICCHRKWHAAIVPCPQFFVCAHASRCVLAAALLLVRRVHHDHASWPVTIDAARSAQRRLGTSRSGRLWRPPTAMRATNLTLHGQRARQELGARFDVWGCSHIGKHRLAGNVIACPGPLARAWS